ncbi:MAG TPA: RsmE family RNA methyltransferase [Dinghuibacter sp.]|uniref:RsmE family RNA methyltransferase n=1 Tax=Dinghuibacter sp. TaxID=2024697 RepID=UPI002BCF7681|nr:RsmE family RNA methyltransferase [Dinghuibacter sp.]HTJ12163.1 RsmE family RNA methyltransferase [Dinghuibacter sp.]
MALPFFYMPDIGVPAAAGAMGPTLELDDPTTRHVVQVLRMRKGDRLLLTDGRGSKTTATLLEADKRYSVVSLEPAVYTERTGPVVYIGISPIKNTSRFEWFLEKATEIGVARIVPVVCERTERVSLKTERLRHILVSAMLQSQQVWLPELTEATPLRDLLRQQKGFIAHCLEERKQNLPGGQGEAWLLIGPEGDFTTEEVTEALSRGWIPVTLGDTRLRTETAGIVGATLLRLAADAQGAT